MTNILITAINAVLPIILLILLGYILKHKNFIPEGFVKAGNKLVFNIGLPCMLFISVYDIEGIHALQWDIVLYSVAAIIILFLVGYGLSLWTTKVRERKGVLLQCVFRSNFAIIGLSLAQELGGSKAVGVAAILSAFTIPVFNILGVTALTMFVSDSKDKQGNLKSILLNIAKNPLIIGVMAGMLCLILRALQEAAFGEVVFAINKEMVFLYKALNNLKSMTTPLALIVLGGQFEFSAVKGLIKEIAVGTFGRTVLAPVIGIGGAVLLSKYTGLLQCGVNEYPALVALFGSPVAVSSAIMAGAMGNDEQLAAQLVVWTSICSVFSLFLIVCVMMAAGLLTV